MYVINGFRSLDFWCIGTKCYSCHIVFDVDMDADTWCGRSTLGMVAIWRLVKSHHTMAVIPIVEAAETPLVSCAAAEAIVQPVKPWVFKTPQSDKHAAMKIYGHMKDNGIKKIAIMSGTTGFGDQGRKQLKAHADMYGITIVADETYAPQDTDMTSQLTKIRGTDAEAIVN